MTSEQSIETSAARLLAAADEALIEAGFRTGRFAQAERLATAAREQAEAEQDGAAEAAAWNVLGYVLHYRSIGQLMAGGQPDPADVAAEREAFGRALAGYEQLRDEAGIAQAAFGIGVFEQVQISLELREQQGEPRRVPSGLVALGWAERENGNPRRAVLLLRRAVEVARAEGLLPARIADAESELAQAEAELAEQESGQ
jgi:hypothetical protein